MGCAVGVGGPNGHHPHHHFFFFAFLAVMLISGAAAGNGSLTSTGQRASRAAARAEHATGGTFAGEENPSGTWEEDAAPWGGMGPGDGSGILPNLYPGGRTYTYRALDHGTGCKGAQPYCGSCIPCPSNPHRRGCLTLYKCHSDT